MKYPSTNWLLISALLFLFSCQPKATLKVNPIELSNYVDAYSTGRISKAGPIQLRLSKPYFTSGNETPEIESGLFSISPMVKGTYSWSNTNTILFTPTEVLESDKTYRVTAKLNKLFPNIGKELNSFEFEISTREQFVTLQLDGLEQGDSQNSETQTLKGTLVSSDIANAKEVEQLVQVKLGSQKLDHLAWEHGQGGLNHNFSLKNIQRADQGQKLFIEIDGAGIGAKEKFTKEVYIPGLNEFKVMNVQFKGGENKFLNVQLSDPNLKDQDLKGLVTIDGYDGKLRFLKEGNDINVYWSNQITGPHNVKIASTLKNKNGTILETSYEKEVIFDTPKPRVRLVGNGVIVPSADGFAFPFEAINLNAVDIEVFKIFNSNIRQYFQNNDYSGSYNLQQVGRIIAQKKIELTNPENNAFQSQWARYALDLSDMISEDPEAIYQIRVGFQPSYTNYPCAAKPTDDPNKNKVNADQFKSIWEDNYYGYNGYYQGYQWKQRDNPCFPAYYNSDHFIARNVIASDLGIIGKRGSDGTTFIAISDLVSLDPVEGANVTFYDFQNQIISTAQTDGEGQINTELERSPFLIMAEHNQSRGYLKMGDGNALSLSKFEVAGVKVQKGMKGYIYGERGVWRPGDTLFLNFMLEKNTAELPADLPVKLTLYNPKNQVIQTKVSTKAVGGIYHFPMKTSPDDLTGNWRAVVNVGGINFSKTLKVETIKPNRLKIEIDMDPSMNNGNITGTLKARWLHGAKANNLKARVETEIGNGYFKIPKFSNFTFHDPSRTEFDKKPKVIFDKALDADGRASLTYKIGKSELLPGRLKQKFRTRVFENGGNFSEDNFSQDLDPFDTYVGVAVPNKKNPWSYLKTGVSHTFDIVSLTKDLDVKPNTKVNVGIYAVDWSWWWERDQQNISRFNSSKHFGAEFSKENIRTNNEGEANFQFQPEGNGRYLVRVCDEEGGHCTGQFFYAGNPWRSSGNNKEAASMLFFSAEKKEYNIGEQATISFPSSANGRALISIENGSKVLETKWINTTANQTEYSFDLQPDMIPTAYVHVTLLQSVREKENDLPLRMYGVIPLKVIDPNTNLTPEIKVAEVLKPEEPVSFEVKEANGKPMAYTVAVVDEGLLSLTRFKTPNAADRFLAKEALGVNTWDMFDQVLSKSGGQLERLLAIGGDEEVDAGDDANSVNRFKPVVQHFGPFYLDKKEAGKHEFIMPNYVGEVRFMVVALGDGAYGKAEKQVPVRKPLMVLSTLPRTLGLGEKVSLPINVFAMEDKVKNVSLSLKEGSGLVNILNFNQQSMNFSEPGSQLGTFEIQVGEQEGVAIFEVEATGAGETATEQIEILIRNPNPYTSDVVFEDVKENERQDLNYALVGSDGSNSAYLEVSAIPSINLEKRMGYLLRYPYGCLEQTTSSAFPQLYLSNFIEMNEGQKKRAEGNINRAIEKMKNFQQARGGFSYWPNSSYYYDWASSYAGHFLLEAKEQGYLVSELMLKNWKKHQSQTAQRWSNAGDKNWKKFNQAYRLFTLALAGSPEMGAMNRLKEYKLNGPTKFRLAAAYALAGQTEIAKNMIAGESYEVPPYLEMEHTFGSNVRDEAMILETLLIIGEEDKANRVALQVARALGSRSWMSTQTCAYALKSMANYVEKYGQTGPFKFEYTLDGKPAAQVSSDRPIYSIELPGKNPGDFKVNFLNASSGVLFTRIVTRGKPLPGSEVAKAKNLVIKVDYFDIEGKPIDVTKLEQGTDFLAKVTIDEGGKTYNRYPNMALAQIFPGGWEITNSRMSAVSRDENTGYNVDYQDIRDDRVYSFFSFYRDVDNKVEIQLQLSATYLGRYYLPSINCEAMYNDQIYANSEGQWVEVVLAGEGS